jgi:F0F1-type ATP synthase membrane subunit b/b'
VRTNEATREQDAIERLCDDETALEQALSSARREAAARVEGARREAGAIASEARRALEDEVSALRAKVSEELERDRAGARASMETAVAELARLADRNRARAVARALAVVLDESAA